MKKEAKVIVREQEAPSRLSRWFKRHYPDFPHSFLEKLLRKGQLRVDGHRAKSSVILEAGQIITLPPVESHPERKKKQVSNEDTLFIRSLILYEDEDFFALNKPSGLAVQGGSKTRYHIDGMLSGLSEDSRCQPRLVHRLDKDTSGLLLLAKTPKSAAFLSYLFRRRMIHKEYLAVTDGVPKPEKGSISGFMKKRKGHSDRERMVLTEEKEEGACYSRTEYELIDKLGQEAALVKLLPLTGRTHQLRLHMKALGAPILGDHKYGDPLSTSEQILHLHAYRITLEKENNKVLEIEAPVPKHIEVSCKRLNLDMSF